MTEQLINDFRNKVNSNRFVFHTYRNKNHMNKWSIICSAMDWISVAVSYISDNGNCFIAGNHVNLKSVKVYTLISCIDMMWEGIQQLHRVIFSTNEIPFVDDNSCFKDEVFHKSDNIYFKTIRACFGAHPVNLNDNFGGNGEREKRYAGWSTSMQEGDFSVFLYSNEVGKQSIYIHIYINELIAFAEKRYNYLIELMLEIDLQYINYIESYKKIKITKYDNPVKQLNVLLNESKIRSENDDYKYEIDKLIILFTCNINNTTNSIIVNRYRNLLLNVINELYDNIQHMVFDELKSLDDFTDNCPKRYSYLYEKLIECVFDKDAFPYLINVQPLLDYVSDTIDTDYTTYDELYTIVEAGLYFKHINSPK